MNLVVMRRRVDAAPAGWHGLAVHSRRTKILATLGPATDAPGRLDELVAAGMDGGRINCAHGDADGLAGARGPAPRGGGARRAAAGAALRPGRPQDAAGQRRARAPGDDRRVGGLRRGRDVPNGAVPVDWPGLAGRRQRRALRDRHRRRHAAPGGGRGPSRRGWSPRALSSGPGAIGPRKGIFCTYVQSPERRRSASRTSPTWRSRPSSAPTSWRSPSSARGRTSAGCAEPSTRWAPRRGVIAKIEKVEAYRGASTRSSTSPTA